MTLHTFLDATPTTGTARTPFRSSAARAIIAPATGDPSRKEDEVVQPSSEIADVLRRIYAAVSEGDEATLSDALSRSDGLVFIGTDPDEWFEERAAIQEMLGAQAKAGVTVRPGPIAAFEEGTVGWVADQGTFVLADGEEVPFRMTMVVHREDGGWKIVQEHASIAVRNEEALGVEL